VQFAEPNYIASKSVNDTYFSPSYMWGMYKIQIEGAWNFGYTGNPSIAVAVLDTGYQRSHPDLAGKVINEIDFVDGGTADDGDGHGTHTAGTIGAGTNNGIGIAAVATTRL
jgi:thermitase